MVAPSRGIALSRAALAALLVGGGCAARPSPPDEQPVKVHAMLATLHGIAGTSVRRDGVSSVRFFASIAPAPPNPNSVVAYQSEEARYYVLHYDRGTIGRADAATVLRQDWDGERLVGVAADVLYWDAGRWVTAVEFMRRRFGPREMAEFGRVVDELRAWAATQPAPAASPP